MTQIIKGSLSAKAKANNTGIAEAFVSADTIIIVDVSGSMNLADAVRNNEPTTRYKAACNELAALQASLPGRIAVVAFSSNVQFCPAGVPIYDGGGTDLVRALEFVQPADGLCRFIVISDGQPDEPLSALALARTFTSRIDTVYVGPANGPGEDFLRQLATARGGSSVTSDRTQQLADNVRQLLLTA
jgi:hypothetical protein